MVGLRGGQSTGGSVTDKEKLSANLLVIIWKNRMQQRAEEWVDAYSQQVLCQIIGIMCFS